MNFNKCEARTGGSISLFMIGVTATLLAHCVLAQELAGSRSASVSTGVAAHYPAGSIRSVEAADLALTAAGKERGEIERSFVEEQNACYTKFFASSCIEDAKEHRRKALAQIRAVEIEANSFKRRTRVEERDRALADKHRQAEEERLERVRQQSINASVPQAQ